MRLWASLLAIGTFVLAFTYSGVYTGAEPLAYNDWVVAQIVNISDGELAGEDTEVVPALPGVNGDGVDLDAAVYAGHEGSETFFSDPRQWSVSQSVQPGSKRGRKWKPHQVGEFVAKRLLHPQASETAKLLRALSCAIRDAKVAAPIRGMPVEPQRPVPRGDYRTHAQQALVKLSAVVAACRSGGASGVGLVTVQRFASLLQQLEDVVELAAREGNAQLAAVLLLESLRPVRVGVAFFEDAALRGGSAAQALEARALLASLVEHLQAVDASLLSAVPGLGQALYTAAGDGTLEEKVALAFEEESTTSTARNTTVLRPQSKKGVSSRLAIAVLSFAVPLFFVGLAFVMAGTFAHELVKHARDMDSGARRFQNLEGEDFEGAGRGSEGKAPKPSRAWELSIFSPFSAIEEDLSPLPFP